MTGSAGVTDTFAGRDFAVKAAASRRTPKKVFRLTLAGGNDSGSVEAGCGRTHREFVSLEHLYYTPMNAKDAARELEQGSGRAASNAVAGENNPDAVNLHYDTRLPELRWSRRMQIPLIAAAVFSLI